MLYFLTSLVVGALLGGLAVWFWLRKRLAPPLHPGADFRVLAYEGDDLHEAKRLRSLCRKNDIKAVLIAHGVNRR